MARLVVVCLIVAEILVFQALADKSEVNPFGDKVQTRFSVADQPASGPVESSDEARVAEAPGIRRLLKHHSDKSVAGGGVIIGGLVTAIFAAVFCYIRVTRRRDVVQ